MPRLIQKTAQAFGDASAIELTAWVKSRSRARRSARPCARDSTSTSTGPSDVTSDAMGTPRGPFHAAPNKIDLREMSSVPTAIPAAPAWIDVGCEASVGSERDFQRQTTAL